MGKSRCWLAAALCVALPSHALTDDIKPPDTLSSVADPAVPLLANVRQLTFEGRRAGEGYFSRDGKQLVFQSEREPGNPFFQIYLMDLQTGDTRRISPGHGKTTCAWIHPSGDQVLFASTQADPQANQKQTEELELRATGEERRYSWDYDAHFDLFVWDRDSETYTNLTQTPGYDAEASWSPDGQWIVFASNRQAYQAPLTARERAAFDQDPASLVDLYLMRSDGTDLRRLTDVPGYDGGPFFSPDGQRICWRRFSTDGARAELFTMARDGSDVRQLTHLDAMSWAPFYHPSGEYLVFTTNRHGFANFELYLVDVDGQRPPVRVTDSPGFDGLPVFTPAGDQLCWTSNRTAGKRSQLFLADWHHDRALAALGLGPAGPTEQEPAAAVAAAGRASQENRSEIGGADVLRHVDYLCRPELGGRRTGTEGEQRATAYVAAYFGRLGLAPAGDDGGWFQNFEFTSGVALGEQNRLAWEARSYGVGQEWQPLAFSQTGQLGAAPVVFAGYGISAPGSDDQAEYDSFAHLDVKDQWLLVLRFLPEDITAERRQHLASHASLRYKAMLARDKGARGLIVVSGPHSQVREQLVPLRFDGSLGGAGVPVISVGDALAESWLQTADRSLAQLQQQLDSGEPMIGFQLPTVQLEAQIDIEQVRQTGRNVLARLQSANGPREQQIIVGAHIDHLGKGGGGSSLARDDERGAIHVGADDNASGVAAMLEVAEYLTEERRSGRLPLQRDLLFAAWSGEELGLLGSSHFVKQLAAEKPTAEEENAAPSIYPAIAACLNMDMVGRLEKKLILQGVGSSNIWRSEIERRNAPLGISITLQNDSYLPTDASTFFVRGVPILSAFTGSHEEYHTPRDTPEKLNYDGTAQIAKLMALIARGLATRTGPPDYIEQAGPESQPRRAQLRAYLGTIPDYSESDLEGVKISGVAKAGPAAQAGLRANDVIVELAGRKIANIYDYTYAIEAVKIGQPTRIVVLRQAERLELQITPGSRD